MSKTPTSEQLEFYNSMVNAQQMQLPFGDGWSEQSATSEQRSPSDAASSQGWVS